MNSSDRVMGLLSRGVPLTLILDLAAASALPEGMLLEAPSLDGLLVGDDLTDLHLEMAV